MTIEKFIRTKTPDWPAITLRKGGTLCINRKGVEQFKLQDVQFVTLFHNQKEGLLYIKPEKDDSDPSTFKIVKEKDRTFTVSCQAFLKFCQVPFRNGSKVYRAVWDDEAEMISINLQQNQ